MCVLTLRKRPAARAWWQAPRLCQPSLAVGLDSTVHSLVPRTLAASLHAAASDLPWLRSVRAVVADCGPAAGWPAATRARSLAAAWICPPLPFRAEAGIMLGVSGAPAAIGIVLGTCPAMAGDRGREAVVRGAAAEQGAQRDEKWSGSMRCLPKTARRPASPLAESIGLAP